MIEAEKLLSICTAFGIDIAKMVEEHQIIVQQLNSKIEEKQKEFDGGSYDVGSELEMLKKIAEVKGID